MWVCQHHVMLSCRPVPALADNYIWLLADEEGNAAIVDPGVAGPVQTALQNANLRLQTILLTHHHPDHIGGVEALRAQWDCAVIGPADHRMPPLDRVVGEGDRVQALPGGPLFEVLEVPGHTSSHIAYHGDQRLFCGDTLFSLGCGRIFDGTARQLHRSLQRLAGLPPQTLVCCAHEYTLANAQFARAVDPHNPDLIRHQDWAEQQRRQNLPTVPTRLATERACNPFLRCDSEPVRAAVRRAGAVAHEGVFDAESVFIGLRAWKDRW